MESARRNLLLLTGTLLAVGLVIVYSASFVFAQKRFGSATFFLERHGIYLLGGCLALAVGALLDYHRIARYWKWYLAFALLLLVAVLMPGVGARVNGARRWLHLASLTLQPSELAKPLLIVGMAAWAVTRRERIATFKEGFLPGAALLGVAVGLVALEPDLGTAALLLAVLGSLLIVAGVKLRHALPALAVAVPVGALCAWSRLGYIQARIHDFLAGTPDPLGRGYQVTQAMIAEGSGGLLGAGVGQGAAKLLFLPEAHNDFIFALIGEELGLIGALGVLSCFALFVWQGWRVARRAPDMLGALIALGVTLLVGLQAAMNIAVVTRSMPTKGISLPLVSYGGSSLIFTLFAIGLLLNVAAHPAAQEVPAPKLAGEESVRFGKGWLRIISWRPS
jgi:cell division protein FtsW